MREQPVAPPHSLSRLQVSEPRHEDINLTLRPGYGRLDEVCKGGSYALQRTVKPQPCVGGYLQAVDRDYCK